MKFLQLSLLFVFALLMSHPIAEAAVLHPRPAEKTEVADQQLSKKELYTLYIILSESL